MSDKVKIASPVEGLNTSTAIGPLVLNFKDSVAEVDSDQVTDGLRAYLEDNGYGIDGSTPQGRKVRLGQAEVPDPRDISAVRVGTPTRDGAVDPRDKDFLGPINAGEANPHGPAVVNPEIHASEGVRPIKAGPVHVDDPGAQDAAEKAHAKAATDGTRVRLTPEEQELLGVDEDGNPTEPDSVQIVGDPDDVDPDDLVGDPDSESTGEPDEAPADAETPAEDLKGKALEDALKAADLPLTGSADERRARLAEHRAQG